MSEVNKMAKKRKMNKKSSKVRATFEIYDNTVSVLNVLFLKLSSDYQKGLIKTAEEFDNAFMKYYRILRKDSSDFIALPDDWAAGVGNNCTGREDVYSSLLADVGSENESNEGRIINEISSSSDSDMFGANEEHFYELLTTLDTEERLNRFMALSKNSAKINPIAHSVLTSFTTNHKYVTLSEYQAPERKTEFMTSDRQAIYDSIEKTFGKFACYSSKSTLTVGNQKMSKLKKEGASNRVAYMSDNTAITIKGYENGRRASFLDFICTVGSDDTKLGKYEGIEHELISFFEGEDLAELLKADFDSLNRLKPAEYVRLDCLIKPIADYYHYNLHDRHLKSGEELRKEFVTDMWNLYSLSIGRKSLFKGVEDYMVSMSKVSPTEPSSATLAKCYFNLCKEFKNDTIERVEYYDAVSVGAL